MQLCSKCRVHPSEYYSVRGAVCENCANNLSNSHGWNWMRMNEDYIGALGGTITTPDEVNQLKTNEGAIIISINNDISSWLNVPDNIRLSWQAFRDGFGKFFKSSTGYLSASSDLSIAQSYQIQIRDWQKRLSVYGELSSPMLPDPSLPVGPPTLSQTISTASSNLRTVAVVGLCVGAAIFLYALYEGHKTAGRAIDFASAHPETMAKLALL